MDRRQQKSRKAIFEAFERLMNRQSYSKITVQQIIDEANVGRTTFYAHFQTKDELLKEMCTELFDHVFSDRPDPESSHNFSLSEGDFHTIVAHILYHLRDKGCQLSQLMTGESGAVFLIYFKEYLNQLVSCHMLSRLEGGGRRVPGDFLRSHICGSFVNMVQWWLQGGMKESPEQLADYYLAVIEPVL